MIILSFSDLRFPSKVFVAHLEVFHILVLGFPGLYQLEPQGIF